MPTPPFPGPPDDVPSDLARWPITALEDTACDATAAEELRAACVHELANRAARARGMPR